MNLRNGKTTGGDEYNNSYKKNKITVSSFLQIPCICDYISSRYGLSHLHSKTSIYSERPRQLQGLNSPSISELYPKINPEPPKNPTTLDSEMFSRLNGRIYGKGFYWKMNNMPVYNQSDDDPGRYFIAYDKYFSTIDNEYVDEYDENGNLVCIPYNPNGMAKEGYYWRYVCNATNYYHHYEYDEWFEQTKIIE